MEARWVRRLAAAMVKQKVSRSELQKEKRCSRIRLALVSQRVHHSVELMVKQRAAMTVVQMAAGWVDRMAATTVVHWVQKMAERLAVP
jgi:hypothetical protein